MGLVVFEIRSKLNLSVGGDLEVSDLTRIGSILGQLALKHYFSNVDLVESIVHSFMRWAVIIGSWSDIGDTSFPDPIDEAEGAFALVPTTSSWVI